MKKIFAVMVAAVALSVCAFAQKPQDDGNGWRDKLKAEKIALLTNEMSLTPEEAQVFWPVYNQLEEQKMQYMQESRDAYKALSAAVKDNKDDAEVAGLLERYIAAQDKAGDFDAKCVAEYEKVLSARKVAKLVLAEERFRKMQFQRLQGGPRPQGGPGQPQQKTK